MSGEPFEVIRHALRTLGEEGTHVIHKESTMAADALAALDQLHDVLAAHVAVESLPDSHAEHHKALRSGLSSTVPDDIDVPFGNVMHTEHQSRPGWFRRRASTQDREGR